MSEARRRRSGPGRPEIGPLVSVRMPRGMIAALDAAARDHGLARAEYIRRLLQVALSAQT